MITSLRWRLAAALLLVLLLGAAAISVFTTLQAQTPHELIEETSLSSQARETLLGIAPDRGSGTRVTPLGGWDAAYRMPNGAFFTLYSPDGHERAKSSNLKAGLPDLPIAAGTTHSRLMLTGPDQVLTQSVRAPDGGRLVVGRVNPEARAEPASDKLLDAAPILTLTAMFVLAMVVVALVADWSLRPLRRAAVEAAAIGPELPRARLSLRGMPDEVRPLAEAVNQALDRVAVAYETEKRFTADAAHALRTPLTVLDLRLQRLESGEAVDATHLRSDVDGIIRIASGLLHLARGDRAPCSADAATTNLARVLREAAAEAAPLLDRAGRSLTVRAPDIVTVRGDAGVWRDCIAALLDNALTHGAGGVDAVLTASEATEAVLRIADQGSGVPAELREQVFERFGKMSGSTRGAGLGLAIVRQTAERHGGSARLFDAAVVEVRAPIATGHEAHS